MKISPGALIVGSLVAGASAFSPAHQSQTTTSATSSSSKSSLQMGLFDRWSAGGSASKDDLDEQWQRQQEILANRRDPTKKKAYFDKVEKDRAEASRKQTEMWSWQTKKYAKGEDPITEWRKRRAEGTISDLDNQYGDPKKIGGIPIPGASFGVGGEFGVGGKFDNGGRFDLRLPYADQGYVDEDSDVMGKISSFFGGGKKKAEPEPVKKEEPPKKKGGWPW